jgi:hypothetical protein
VVTEVRPPPAEAGAERGSAEADRTQRPESVTRGRPACERSRGRFGPQPPQPHPRRPTAQSPARPSRPESLASGSRKLPEHTRLRLEFPRGLDSTVQRPIVAPPRRWDATAGAMPLVPAMDLRKFLQFDDWLLVSSTLAIPVAC